MDLIHPVGSIYLSTNDVNPSTLFGGTWKKVENENELPAEYQQVEYIESTGTQYIDTGIKPNTNYGLLTKINYSKQNTQFNRICGCRSNELNFLLISIQTNSSNESITSQYKSAFHPFKSLKSDGYDIEIEMIENVAKVDNETYTFSDNTFSQSTSNFVLFAGNNQGVIERHSMMKMYYFKIYDCGLMNNSLQRNFIPCYRKSDNTIGLYDLVNNKFYTNAGTGTFLKGNKVHLKWERMA